MVYATLNRVCRQCRVQIISDMQPGDKQGLPCCAVWSETLVLTHACKAHTQSHISHHSTGAHPHVTARVTASSLNPDEVVATYRGPKIGASIKLASQRDGVDLDPQGTKFQPRGEGGPPGQGGRRPVGSQVGQATGRGHLQSITPLQRFHVFALNPACPARLPECPTAAGTDSLLA